METKQNLIKIVLFEAIKVLVEENSNDADLGKKVRIVINSNKDV